MSQQPSKSPDLLVYEIAVILIPLAIFFGAIALGICAVLDPSLTLSGKVFTVIATHIIGGMGLWGFIDSFRH
jgi:hypothetical protein